MWLDAELVRVRAYEISTGWEAGTAEENWLRAERELAVAHDYDTVERDLERLGMTVCRLPAEAGVVWRLRLPRGEQVEAWEPGNDGLAPPGEIRRLIAGVVGRKPLVPMPTASSDPGAIRLRETIEAQRLALLRHDAGTRLGADPENLHQHRVAARRIRAFLRATRAYVDPTWRRLLNDPLRQLGERTGPVRDLDVLLAHVREELERLGEDDRPAGDALFARLTDERDRARQPLLHALDDDALSLAAHAAEAAAATGSRCRAGSAAENRGQGVRSFGQGDRSAGRPSGRHGDPRAADHAQACALRRRVVGAAREGG